MDRILDGRGVAVAKRPEPARDTSGRGVGEGDGQRHDSGRRHAVEVGVRADRSGVAVVDHQREVLVGAVAVSRNPVARDRRCGHGHREGARLSGGAEDRLGIVAAVCCSSRTRVRPGEHVSFVGRSAYVNRQIQVVDPGGGTGRAARRVGPDQTDPERLAGVGHRAGDLVGRSGGREQFGLVHQNHRRPGEGPVQIHASHALAVAGQGVVGVVAGQVLGGIHQHRFVHGGSRRGPALVQEILPDQRRAACQRRTGVAGPARPAVQRLAGRPVGVAYRRTVKQSLRHTSLDMRALGRNLRLPAAVTAGRVDRAVAGEVDHVVDVVGAGVRDAATVGAGLAVVLGGADRQDVLGGARRGDGVRTRSVVPRGEDDHVLLVAGLPGAGVPNEFVILLGIGVVDRNRVVGAIDEAPGVGADPGAMAVGGALPGGSRRASGAEDGGTPDPSPGSESKAVLIPVGILVGRTGRVVVSRNDVGVQETVAAHGAALSGGVFLEDDPTRGEVRMSCQEISVVDHIDRERAELAAVEAGGGQPGEVAGACGRRAAHVVGGNLSLDLVEALLDETLLYREHVRESGEGREQHRIEVRFHVQVGADAVGEADRRGDGSDRIEAGSGRRSVNQLDQGRDGIPVGALRRRSDSCRHPEGRLPRTDVLHFRPQRLQAIEIRNLSRLGGNHIRVHGDVLDDPYPGVLELGQPGIMNRPDELDQMKSGVDQTGAVDEELRLHGRERCLRSGAVQAIAVRRDDVLFVPHRQAGTVQGLPAAEDRLIHEEQVEGAVVLVERGRAGLLQRLDQVDPGALQNDLVDRTRPEPVIRDGAALTRERSLDLGGKRSGKSGKQEQDVGGTES